ncbi:hypothetical protein D3C76_1601460 [compost metagenome]
MMASEQIPPMELLVEKHVGGSSVLGVRSEEELKQYVQDVFNKTEAANPSGSTTNGDNGSSDSGNSSKKSGQTGSISKNTNDTQGTKTADSSGGNSSGK